MNHIIKRNVITFMNSFNYLNDCDSNKHLHNVLTNFSNQVGPNDVVLHDGWLTEEYIKETIEYLQNKSIRNIYYISLVDEMSYLWEECTHRLGKICEQVKVLGNTEFINKEYYSFWLDFVYTYRQDFLSFNVKDIQPQPKTFMCLNRKRHHHRFYLWRALRDKKLSKHGHISYGNLQNLLEDVKNECEFEIRIKIPNNIQSLGHPNNWNTHFLNIVTETGIQLTEKHFFISEKTFKPIVGHRPFVVLSGSRFYNRLHDLGFDTFDDIFGTGYKADSLTGIVNWIIDVIQEMEKENKIALYKKLLPRLEENYNVFLKVGKENQKRRDNLCR